MKKWKNLQMIKDKRLAIKDVIKILLKNRRLVSKKDIDFFLQPPDPYQLNAKDVGIDALELNKAVKRIKKAIKNKESIVVYADYDADGITSGAIMWQTLYALGARVMPYIPHRVEEGYGLSIKGIDKIITEIQPTLIITVDHGITGWEKVAYARKKGIDVIVTDHHVKPKKLPACTTVHTTELSGAGVAWFLAKEVLKGEALRVKGKENELLALTAIGTIADMVSLTAANRAIAKHGLAALNQSSSIGLKALFDDARIERGKIGTYEISHIIAPRLNAMGRIVHALDALRLLCTGQPVKAQALAKKLSLTNIERQLMTEEMTLHAKDLVAAAKPDGKKLLFVAHEDYNPGVIGLVAGKLVEQFYLPAIVVSKGPDHSKASARSITGFNIIEAIRSCSELLIDAGGHPMAAGFTVATSKLDQLQKRLEGIAANELTPDKLKRVLKIDMEIPLEIVSQELWLGIQDFAPFGMANPEPVFASKNLSVVDARVVGTDGKHLKLKLADTNNSTNQQSNNLISAIGFGMGELYSKLSPTHPVDVAYTIDLNTWNNKQTLQLKLKDILI